jgi:hypothetical protein
MRWYLIAAILLASHPIRADEPFDPCLQAIQESAHVESWSGLHSFREKYRSCPDDGIYAEIYSDLVTTILSNRWASLAKLDAIASRDPNYLDFVLRHIDLTARQTASIASRSSLRRAVSLNSRRSATGSLQLLRGSSRERSAA